MNQKSKETFLETVKKLKLWIILNLVCVLIYLFDVSVNYLEESDVGFQINLTFLNFLSFDLFVLPFMVLANLVLVLVSLVQRKWTYSVVFLFAMTGLVYGVLFNDFIPELILKTFFQHSK